MRVILVTSKINYCPGNYDAVLRSILSDCKGSIAGVIIVRGNMFKAFLSLIRLKLSACDNICSTLFANLISSWQKKKESIFSENHIPFLSTKDVNSDRVRKWIKNLDCDLLINLRTREIFKDKLLNLPRLGCLNVHHGLLPEQRGLFCDLFAMNRSKCSGFTVHKMTKEVDSGPIYYRKTVGNCKDYMQYLQKLARVEGEYIGNLINEISKKKKLPEEKAVNFHQVVITTTPTSKQIREFQKNGIIL